MPDTCRNRRNHDPVIPAFAQVRPWCGTTAHRGRSAAASVLAATSGAIVLLVISSCQEACRLVVDQTSPDRFPPGTPSRPDLRSGLYQCATARPATHQRSPGSTATSPDATSRACTNGPTRGPGHGRLRPAGSRPLITKRLVRQAAAAARGRKYAAVDTYVRSRRR